MGSEMCIRDSLHFILQADAPYLQQSKTAWDEKLKEAFVKHRPVNWNEPTSVSVAIENYPIIVEILL